MRHYKIYELSARAVLMNGKPDAEGVYHFELGEEATGKCISKTAPEAQDDCALFHQILSARRAKGISDAHAADQLEYLLLILDFSRIFDRPANNARTRLLQKQAEDLFRPEGLTLDFGPGPWRYLAFERSNSMSRNARLTFIREDYYEAVRERIMLGMEIGKCQLSKLYAYNGLMLTSGQRLDMIDVSDPRKVIVVDNETSIVHNADIITMVDDGTDRPMRTFERQAGLADVEITEFDGEGVISEKLARQISSLCDPENMHHSFQIRMPYIKGVVHEVDFPALYREWGVSEIRDIWGKSHPVDEVEMILTKSMFKGFGWMTENRLSWAEYLARCRQYDHALYISELDQPMPEATTRLNYQFLNTAAIRAAEFRPADLPDAWEHSPEEDPRPWVTKATETAYYRFAIDEDARLHHFDRDPQWSSILRKNPLFLREPLLTRELDANAERVLRDYSMGKLIVEGDNRYLSGDLLRFLYLLVKDQLDETLRIDVDRECLGEGEVYAPGAVYPENDTYTILRNPHIARNEEAVARAPEVGYFREKYLSHLHYVVMVDSRTLIPERLGGADFDGDMVKIVADPLLNACVSRNYTGNAFDSFSAQIPVLKIPSMEPLLRDAGNWHDRFEVVKATFDARIGLICNAAFDRGVVAYNENTDDELKHILIEETEELEILTGMEIDSAKTGVKPAIDFYVQHKLVDRSSFQKYKNIMKGEDGREWYEPTVKEKLDEFFQANAITTQSSNVEKLPFLAKALADATPKRKEKPVRDAELFTFAKERGWKEKLDPAVMDFTRSLIADYDSVLRRIRMTRVEPKKMNRRSDVERILFSRGQEEQYMADELYGVFQNTAPQKLREDRQKLREKRWHLTTGKEREYLLLEILPYTAFADYAELFGDFRQQGFRLLPDIICDLDDYCRDLEQRENAMHRQSDGAFVRAALEQYQRERGSDYARQVNRTARQFINGNQDISPDEVLKCAIALGKRSFAFEVLLDRVEEYAAEVEA